MLTVNHSDIDHIQTIYEVMRAEYNPNEGSCEEGSEPCEGSVKIYCTTDDGDSSHHDVVKIYSGNVYIMNSEAKTIATYRLGGWSKDLLPKLDELEEHGGL